MRALTWHGKRDVRVDDGPRPDDRGADRRDRPHHVDRDLRLRPAPLRGARAVHRRGRHPRPRADGHRRGGRLRGHPHRSRRPGRHPVQHLLRPLLDVRSQDLQSQCETTQVREQDKGASLFGYTKLYGQVPGGQAEYLRVPQAHFGPIKVPDGPPGRALPLPLRRAADRLAGGRVRGDPRRRQRRRLRARPDRPDGRPHRPPPRRRAGSSASTSSPSAWRWRGATGSRRSTSDEHRRRRGGDRAS